jgi:uncharacterized protein
VDVVDLTPEEIRVLGCLLEKERTTPDAYPLSLNGLVTACNQTTSRDPVMRLRDDEVESALDRLRARELVRRGVYPGSRVIKYRHCLDEALELDVSGLALLAVLLLRGPQPAGELKTRTERLHGFADVAAVDDGLGVLASRVPPLAERLAREPGRKDARWVHRLGAPSGGSDPAPARPLAVAPDLAPDPAPDPAPDGAPDLEARVAALERTVAELQERLDR